MTDYSCPKCGLVESTWAAQENETGSGCPECMFIRIRELEAVIAAGTEYTGQILARAEKAEARAQDAEETCILFAEEESKLRARVAELETGERFTEKQFRALEKAGWHLLEAREREAD